MIVNRSLLLAILILIAFNCGAQRKIKMIDVQETGFSVDLNFKVESNELTYNNLKLKITPLSASDLNEKFLHESGFNGKFEYSHYDISRDSYFLQRPKKKREKTDSEFLLEGVNWLLENDKINNEEFIDLNKQIILNYNSEYGISSSKLPISSNPYYVGDKYLNVYEYEISNQTNTYQKLNSRLLIESGNLLLHPLSNEEIIEKLVQCQMLNQDKINSLDRYNLPTEIVIPPNSKFIKYFATVPIDYNNDELKISFEGLSSKFKWKIEKAHNSFDEKYKFFELSTNWIINDYPIEGEHYYILKAASNVYFIGDAAFIGDKNLNDEFELISISLYLDKLYFSRGKFKGANYLDQDKNKRKYLEIRLSKIDELTKKVK
jgi:hypothetical protein